MGRPAARATHLVLWLIGVALYIVFVIPRWWVLIGDIPATAAAFGRIATGFPIAAAAVPVGLTLQRSLKRESETPELALRLRAWSAVLHVVAGVLIIVTAVAEIWLDSPGAAPWLFGVYGGAGSLAVLAAAAFALSFPAELPPLPPKPAPIKPEKTSDKEPKQRRTRRRNRKQAEPEFEAAGGDPKASEEPTDSAEASETAGDEAEDPGEDAGEDGAATGEPEDGPAAEDDAGPEHDTVPVEDAESAGDDTSATEASSAGDESADQRPVGKKRHRLRR